MDDIIVLDIKYKFYDNEGTIHPVVLKDDNEMILIDCGYIGFMPIIEDALREKNLDCNQLTKIVITHHDHDHMGALADFKQKYPNVKIVASEIEAPYIEGKKKSLRLQQAEALQDILSPEHQSFGKAFCEILKSVKPVKVDLLVHDGDVMNWCGGCTIIGTPGHTPGHISLYLENKKTIITGDAAALENNLLVIANPQFTLDIENANKSISKLLEYDAERYICYHGGIFERSNNNC